MPSGWTVDTAANGKFTITSDIPGAAGGTIGNEVIKVSSSDIADDSAKVTLKLTQEGVDQVDAQAATGSITFGNNLLSAGTHYDRK